MKILITDDGYLSESADKPIVGRRYVLQDAEDATLKQNNAFHALVLEYWKWGGHPKYGGDGYTDFRDKIKRDLGAGFESFVYATIEDGRPRLYLAKQYEDIPEDVRQAPDLKLLIRGKLKSWADYKKKERQKTIDNLLDDIRANGCNTDKMNEIIEGMSDERP